MRCLNCKKKCIHICCTYCLNNYCSRCIQTEIHKCSEMEKKQMVDKKNLFNKLVIEKKKVEWV